MYTCDAQVWKDVRFESQTAPPNHFALPILLVNFITFLLPHKMMVITLPVDVHMDTMAVADGAHITCACCIPESSGIPWQEGCHEW